MKKKPTDATLNVQGTEITVISQEEDDFISLTDMVRGFDGGPALIEQWLKNKDTVLFLGIWERLNNPGFKTPEFEGIKTRRAGTASTSRQRNGPRPGKPTRPCGRFSKSWGSNRR